MTVLRYTVPPENEGCKLGLFLRMQGVTAGLIKSVKYDGDGFYADDQPIRTNEPVHAGQCIRFALPPEQETSVTPQPVPFSMTTFGFSITSSPNLQSIFFQFQPLEVYFFVSKWSKGIEHPKPG